MPWSVTEEEPALTESESDLEKRFRVVLAERLKALGATITEKPSDQGITWDIALGSGNRWTLRPQENVLGSKPDFVLTSARPGVPPTAIFTDGWVFHASPAHNRIADDAEKRRNLRDGGYQVVAVTRDDVDGVMPESPAFRPETKSTLLGMAGDQLSNSAVDLVFRNAIDLLVAWIQQPTVDSRRQLAHWLPLLGLVGLQNLGRRAEGDVLSRAALSALDDTLQESATGDTLVWRHGGLAVAIRMPESSMSSTEVAVVLDDRDSALSEHSKDEWREWLRWSNLLNFRSLPTEITSRKHLASLDGTPAVEADRVVADGLPAGLSGPWLDAYEDVSVTERGLMVSLATAGLPVPDIGEEVGGIPVEICWPSAKVAVKTGMTHEEQNELSQAGWVLCEPDADSVRAVLQTEGA
jgi:hypothetical protein